MQFLIQTNVELSKALILLDVITDNLIYCTEITKGKDAIVLLMIKSVVHIGMGNDNCSLG